MNPMDYLNLTAAMQWANGTGTATVDFAKAAPVMAIIIFVVVWFVFGRK